MFIGRPVWGNRNWAGEACILHLASAAAAFEVHTMMNILAYADGERDLVSLAERIEVPAETCVPIIERLLQKQLLERID